MPTCNEQEAERRARETIAAREQPDAVRKAIAAIIAEQSKTEEDPLAEAGRISPRDLPPRVIWHRDTRPDVGGTITITARSGVGSAATLQSALQAQQSWPGLNATEWPALVQQCQAAQVHAAEADRRYQRMMAAARQKIELAAEHRRRVMEQRMIRAQGWQAFHQGMQIGKKGVAQ